MHGGANLLLDAAREIQAFCEAKRWSFCFIGGVAVQHWGEARVTRDAGLTVFTGIGDEGAYVDALLGGFKGRLADARDFALRHRVVLLYASNGIPLDVSLGALAFEQQAVGTATLEEVVPGERLRLASPASLVVFKAFAGRALDWDWVERHLRALLELKGDTAAIERLAGLRAKSALR